MLKIKGILAFLIEYGNGYGLRNQEINHNEKSVNTTKLIIGQAHGLFPPKGHGRNISNANSPKNKAL